jgi:hypothetical protein
MGAAARYCPGSAAADKPHDVAVTPATIAIADTIRPTAAPCTLALMDAINSHCSCLFLPAARPVLRIRHAMASSGNYPLAAVIFG